MKPFFKNFDYIFTNFNSATSYSNPAVLRLLRSTCGQTTEDKLFTDVNSQCYIMEDLRKLGYSTYTILNHDGNYSGFKDAIVKYGKADVPLDNSKLKPAEVSFDDTLIYSDKDALSLWFASPEADIHKNSALFYNSITLHTGSKYVNNPYLSNNDQYTLSLSDLTNDINEIFDRIKKTNRKTIVLLVGEHGAAIRGSALQPATVREIPLPQITQVPAVIKFFGPGFNERTDGYGIVNDKPLSYLGIMELLSRVLQKNPYNGEQLLKLKLTDNLPETSFVSESQSGTILQNDLGLFYKLKKYENWDILPSSLSAGASDYFSR